MITNKELDLIRESFIEEWTKSDAYNVWHRNYKEWIDPNTINFPYRDKQVIVISPTDQWLLYNYNNSCQSFYSPFVYKGVPIKLWK